MTCFLWAQNYPWLQDIDISNTLVERIPAPEGYERIPVEPGSFAEWFRNLPLKQGNPPVYLYNGEKKFNQSAHFAVINIDTGDRDLQQCADAIMRLRGEYLYSLRKYQEIHFNFTSGDTASFSKWAEGYRPRVQGNRVSWVKSKDFSTSYENFKSYMKTVFVYAGTYSLKKEMKKIPLTDIQIGDLFIQAGFPGHAVLVADMAVCKNAGKTVFLLIQSYMPAQDMHVLKNPSQGDLSQWYSLEFGPELATPEWTFQKEDLRRFR